LPRAVCKEFCAQDVIIAAVRLYSPGAVDNSDYSKEVSNHNTTCLGLLAYNMNLTWLTEGPTFQCANIICWNSITQKVF